MSPARADRVARRGFLACAALSAAAAAAVVGVLAVESTRFFLEVPVVGFLLGTTWAPFAEEPRFGVLPLLAATAQITAGAAVIAVPLGLATAVYVVHYAAPRTARVVGTSMSVLAGFPTVVLGCFALEFATPALARVWPATEAFNGASACLVVGVLILPMVAALSRQALEATPPSLVNAALALGASRGRTVLRVAGPAALRGLAAAVFLALARAAGETMIVTMAAGAQGRLAWSPLEGLRTLTTFIAQANMGGAAPDAAAHRAVFAAAAVLCVLTFGLHAAGRSVLARPPFLARHRGGQPEAPLPIRRGESAEWALP